MCSILVVTVAIYAILKLLIYLLSYLLHHQIYCNQTITSITIMKAIEQLSIPGPMPMLCQRQCPHLVSAVSREPAGGQAPSVASGQTHSVDQCSYTTLYTLLSTFAFFVGTRVTQCIQLPASSSHRDIIVTNTYSFMVAVYGLGVKIQK